MVSSPSAKCHSMLNLQASCLDILVKSTFWFTTLKKISFTPFKSSYVFLVLVNASPLSLSLQYPHLGHQLETFLEFNSYNSFKQGFVTYIPSSTLLFHDLHNINMISLGQFLVTIGKIKSPKLDNNLEDIHTFRNSMSN